MPKSKRKWRRSCSKSGYFGVRKGRDRGRIEKYRAQIYINGKNKYRAHIYIDGNQKYLGTYDTAKQAAKAHDKEAIHLRRPFSALNYPKQAPVGYTPIQKARLSNNVVGYRGVYIYGKKYQASIYIDRKKAHLGNYDTAHEAAVAYDRAVLKANKSTSLLNFPDMVHNLDVDPEAILPAGWVHGTVVNKNGQSISVCISPGGRHYDYSIEEGVHLFHERIQRQ